MSYYEVGTVSRIIEEYEGVMPAKALRMAMVMAKEVHRELKAYHKECLAYSISISCCGIEAYDKSRRIEFEHPCDDLAPLEKLIADFFDVHVKKGIPVNSIYVSAEGVHSVLFGVFL